MARNLLNRWRAALGSNPIGGDRFGVSGACLRPMHLQRVVLRDVSRDARFAPCPAERATLARRSRLRGLMRVVPRWRPDGRCQRECSPWAACAAGGSCALVRGLPRQRCLRAGRTLQRSSGVGAGRAAFVAAIATTRERQLDCRSRAHRRRLGARRFALPRVAAEARCPTSISEQLGS
jgi:hypothetical protein